MDVRPGNKHRADQGEPGFRVNTLVQLLSRERPAALRLRTHYGAPLMSNTPRAEKTHVVLEIVILVLFNLPLAQCYLLSPSNG